MLPSIVVAILVWCVACLAARHAVAPWLRSQCGGSDALTGALALVVRAYTRLVHRVEFVGADLLRSRPAPGPLVVVSNHTAGIDPLLIQSACRFHIRWMMARDMMTGSLAWLWKRERMVPVDFDASDSGAAREAMRHVQQGGVLGVFPEGGLARPPERIHPFLPGVGLIVARTEAPVLLCWISGTPKRDRAVESVFVRSRSRVEFLDVLRYPPRTKPKEIVEDLRRRLAEASGWETIDRAASLRRQATET